MKPRGLLGLRHRQGALLVLAGWLGLGSGMADGNGVPLVTWHSQPARPGQTVLVYGDGLSAARVHIRRLQDTPPGLPGNAGTDSEVPAVAGMESIAIQPREQALKVLLPEGDAPGVFSLQVTAGDRRQTVLVNAPQPWWARGADRLEASPGNEVRVFGLGLGWMGEACATRLAMGLAVTGSSTRSVPPRGHFLGWVDMSAAVNGCCFLPVIPGCNQPTDRSRFGASAPR